MNNAGTETGFHTSAKLSFAHVHRTYNEVSYTRPVYMSVCVYVINTVQQQFGERCNMNILNRSCWPQHNQLLVLNTDQNTTLPYGHLSTSSVHLTCEVNELALKVSDK